jgi:putative tributyrin esterase
MAFIHMNLISTSLMRTVPVNVIVPVDKPNFPGVPARGDKPYKTLYLLHGVLGSYVDWVNGTRIQRFAEMNDLVVVMPSGDNSFYVDMPRGNDNYGEFIGKELVELTRKIFPLSHKREDTFIGGLSMGGYGAIRNGLKYHDTFGYIIGLSSALITDDLPNRKSGDKVMFFETKEFRERCFGDLTKVAESDMNPKYLVKTLKKQKIEFPKFYLACGQDDGLLPKTEDFVSFLRQNDIEVTFETGPGAHEWNFWDTFIEKAIKWLPIEDGMLGLNSGNIGDKA